MKTHIVKTQSGELDQALTLLENAIAYDLELRFKRINKSRITPKEIHRRAMITIQSIIDREMEADVKSREAEAFQRGQIDELEGLNMYYLQHDGEGEHKLAAQFDVRLAALQQPNGEGRNQFSVTWRPTNNEKKE